MGKPFSAIPRARFRPITTSPREADPQHPHYKSVRAPASYKFYPDVLVSDPRPIILLAPMAAAASSSSADLATLGRRLPLDGVKRNDCYGHGSGEGCRSRGCAPSSVPGAEGQEGPVSEGGAPPLALRTAQA
ncbi:hypothetical protein BHE74_00007948 [Ensete ventricosum]|nr:hypothetical protein GW17_00037616 [Ensete ventricosum]RWW83542.1 hypothetical protein BHE74_00007948 [Ensete ventricosum]